MGPLSQITRCRGASKSSEARCGHQAGRWREARSTARGRPIVPANAVLKRSLSLGPGAGPLNETTSHAHHRCDPRRLFDREKRFRHRQLEAREEAQAGHWQIAGCDKARTDGRAPVEFGGHSRHSPAVSFPPRGLHKLHGFHNQQRHRASGEQNEAIGERDEFCLQEAA